MNDPSREPRAYIDTGGLLSRASGHIRPGGERDEGGAPSTSPKSYPALPVALTAEVEARRSPPPPMPVRCVRGIATLRHRL